MQSVVVSVESMNNIVLFGVNLVFDVQNFLNKVDEFFHLVSEQSVNLDGKFVSEFFNVFLTRSSVRQSLAPATLIKHSASLLGHSRVGSTLACHSHSLINLTQRNLLT